jgi:flagellar hook protein FlgE
MFPAFSIALSALNADSTGIDVVGNNLANLNTAGFKASDVDFQDLMYQTLGVGSNGQVGMGVGQISAIENFTQGAITTTNGPTDAAIEGNGFFVVKDSNSNTLYTRAGDFQLDANGNLVTAAGDMVQGWTAVDGVVNPNGPVSNLNFPVGTTTPAVATTSMSMNVNLDSSAAIGASFSAPVQVYDSQGTAHTLTITMTKTAANSWSYVANVPASDQTAPAAGGLLSGALTFDANGNLTAPVGAQVIPITGLSDGAADMSINWNLVNSSGANTITQYAQSSGVSNPVQDGSAAGQITSIGLENGGILVANYSNGQQVTVGQLAMASITNPGSLIQVGNNNLEASAATAQPALGAAGTGGRGQIIGGSIEASTADMATQFTDLLSYERSYQAASRVITTSDQLLQETVNLIHP